jgi:hypothetical protein
VRRKIHFEYGINSSPALDPVPGLFRDGCVSGRLCLRPEIALMSHEQPVMIILPAVLVLAEPPLTGTEQPLITKLKSGEAREVTDSPTNANPAGTRGGGQSLILSE